MIALVRGQVAGRRATLPAGGEVVIDVAGTGYRLAVSGSTLEQVPVVGEQVRLYTHMVVREDAMLLYGFVTEEERDLFLMLLGVQSVGPKAALAVLSRGEPADLLSALAAGNPLPFLAAPGIGRRTAERIVSELRKKAGPAPESAAPAVAGGFRALARESLIALGFPPREADRLLTRANGETTEALIADALRASRR